MDKLMRFNPNIWPELEFEGFITTADRAASSRRNIGGGAVTPGRQPADLPVTACRRGLPFVSRRNL